MTCGPDTITPEDGLAVGKQDPLGALLCAVWIDDWQMDRRLRPRWRSVQRLVGVCVEGGSLRSEKHHRQLTGSMKLSPWLPDTVFTVLLKGLQTGAHP